MPTVLSVTLALGAFTLAKEGAIVSRMSGAWAHLISAGFVMYGTAGGFRRAQHAGGAALIGREGLGYELALHLTLFPQLWRRWLAWTSCALTRPVSAAVVV